MNLFNLTQHQLTPEQLEGNVLVGSLKDIHRICLKCQSTVLAGNSIWCNIWHCRGTIWSATDYVKLSIELMEFKLQADYLIELLKIQKSEK